MTRFVKWSHCIRGGQQDFQARMTLLELTLLWPDAEMEAQEDEGGGSTLPSEITGCGRSLRLIKL